MVMDLGVVAIMDRICGFLYNCSFDRGWDEAAKIEQQYNEHK